MKKIDKLRSILVVALMVFIIGVVVSLLSAHYEDKAVDAYADWLEAEEVWIQ